MKVQSILQYTVEIKCSACRLWVRAPIHLTNCPNCPNLHPAYGTLTGDWLVRITKSHRNPKAEVLGPWQG